MNRPYATHIRPRDRQRGDYRKRQRCWRKPQAIVKNSHAQPAAHCHKPGYQFRLNIVSEFYIYRFKIIPQHCHKGNCADDTAICQPRQQQYLNIPLPTPTSGKSPISISEFFQTISRSAFAIALGSKNIRIRQRVVGITNSTKPQSSKAPKQYRRLRRVSLELIAK